MRTIAIAISLILTLAVTGEGDIYKWTDEDGNVHYGDRPEGEMVERVSIDSRPTDPNRIQEMTQARVDARNAAADAEAEAVANAPSEEELQAEKEERERNCTISRERMQQLVTARSLYREDENGERIYLDEEDKQTARKNVENLISKYCSS